MNERIIQIANTKTQRRYSITTNATTLGELQDVLTAQGIDFTGMSFTEGISKTQLLTRDSLLPTNVMYKGQPTNNLVMLLTNTTKNIVSGAMSRKDAYDSIKACGMQEAVKERFGRNFTQVSTADLEQFLWENSEEVEVTNPHLNEEGEVVVDEIITPGYEEKVPDVKTAPHPETVEWFYMGLKAMLKSNLLYADDIAVIADLTTELYKRLKETEPIISDDDIDDMIANM